MTEAGLPAAPGSAAFCGPVSPGWSSAAGSPVSGSATPGSPDPASWPSAVDSPISASASVGSEHPPPGHPARTPPSQPRPRPDQRTQLAGHPPQPPPSRVGHARMQPTHRAGHPSRTPPSQPRPRPGQRIHLAGRPPRTPPSQPRPRPVQRTHLAGRPPQAPGRPAGQSSPAWYCRWRARSSARGGPPSVGGAISAAWPGLLTRRRRTCRPTRSAESRTHVPHHKGNHGGVVIVVRHDRGHRTCSGAIPRRQPGQTPSNPASTKTAYDNVHEVPELARRMPASEALESNEPLRR